MGDRRYERSYAAIAEASDRARAIREARDDQIVQALAVASMRDPFLANVLATEAMNRMHRAAAITQHLAEGVLAVNHEGVVTFANPAAERILGRDAADLVGRPVAEALPLYDREGRHIPPGEQPVLRVLRHAERVSWDDAYTRDEGGRRVPLSFVWVPILRDGEVTGAVAALVDATRRRKADAERASLLSAERDAREEAQRREREARFLARASLALAESAEPREMLATLARLAVPELADWCAVHVLEADGEVRALAVAHADPRKADLARELQRRHPPRKDAPHGVWNVIRTGKPEHHPEITPRLLEESARDEEHAAMLGALGMRSAIVAPLRARGTPLGAITFVTTRESGRTYDERMVALTLDLASRAALALDHARLVARLKEMAGADPG